MTGPKLTLRGFWEKFLCQHVGMQKLPPNSEHVSSRAKPHSEPRCTDTRVFLFKNTMTVQAVRRRRRRHGVLVSGVAVSRFPHRSLSYTESTTCRPRVSFVFEWMKRFGNHIRTLIIHQRFKAKSLSSPLSTRSERTVWRDRSVVCMNDPWCHWHGRCKIHVSPLHAATFPFCMHVHPREKYLTLNRYLSVVY